MDHCWVGGGEEVSPVLDVARWEKAHLLMFVLRASVEGEVSRITPRLYFVGTDVNSTL